MISPTQIKEKVILNWLMHVWSRISSSKCNIINSCRGLTAPKQKKKKNRSIRIDKWTHEIAEPKVSKIVWQRARRNVIICLQQVCRGDMKNLPLRISFINFLTRAQIIISEQSFIYKIWPRANLNVVLLLGQYFVHCITTLAKGSKLSQYVHIVFKIKIKLLHCGSN